ncbi:hypothetical protein QZH41_015547, partial [Actinostola sp. cb2023]
MIAYNEDNNIPQKQDFNFDEVADEERKKLIEVALKLNWFSYTDCKANKQASRQAGKQASRQAGKQASRQAGKQASRQAGKQASRQAGKQASRQAGKQASRQAGKQASRQAGKQASRQAGKQASRQRRGREEGKKERKKWEFTSRDINHNGHLDLKEIKAMVDEREPCMVALLSACDFDGEPGVSHHEWNSCFPIKLQGKRRNIRIIFTKELY